MKRKRVVHLLFAGLATIVLFFSFGKIAQHHDEQGKIALYFLSFAVNYFSIGEVLIENAAAFVFSVITFSVMSFLVLVVWEFCESRNLIQSLSSLVFLSSFLAVGGFLAGESGPGAVILALAVVCTILMSRAAQGQKPMDNMVNRFDLLDVVSLVSIILIALIFRTYALNRVSAFFEGELAPYFFGAMDLQGIILANGGVSGPWAPLGLLYYIPIYICYHLYGVSLLSVRLASVATSLLTIFLLYCWLRECWGRISAVVGSLFLCFESLQIGWGRTDIHPHASNTYPTLILCLVLYKALSTGRKIWLFLLPFSMALTWHQYPSGQCAIIIPILVWFSAFIFNVRMSRQTAIFPAYIVGIVFYLLSAWYVTWLSGVPLDLFSYAGQLGPRFHAYQELRNTVGQTSVSQIFFTVFGNLFELILAPFVEAKILFHQDIFISLPGLPIRTFSWGGAAFALCGLIMTIFNRTKLAGLILVSWIITGLIPATFSDAPFPKRASSIYPALCAFAGIGVQYLYQELITRRKSWLAYILVFSLSINFLAWYFVTTYQWFSGAYEKIDRPGEYSISEYLCPRLRPFDVVLIASTNSYYHPKFVFVHYKCLIDRAAQPIVFLGYNSADKWVYEVPLKPEAITEKLNENPYYYLWSPLRTHLSPLQSIDDWNRLIYIIQLDENGMKLVKFLMKSQNLLSVTEFSLRNSSHNKFAIVKLSFPD